MSTLLDNLYSISSIKEDIKSAIAEKGVDMTGLSFADYPGAISSIQTGGNLGYDYVFSSNGVYDPYNYGYDGFAKIVVDVPFVTATLSVSQNGIYYPGASANGYSPVVVDVQPELQDKTVVANGEYIADQGYYGLGTVTVSVPSPQFVTESLSVSVNGTYTPGQGVDGFSQVVVDVPQSVTGYTEKEITEGVQIVNLSNSASFVRSTAFTGNIMLKTVYLPNCTTVGNSAFDGCQNLETVYLPSCSYIGKYGFNNCKFSFISVSLNALIIDEFAFADCLHLHYVDLTNCNQINRYAFRYCANLESVYINYSSVTSLAANVFQTTNSTFKVYVPSSLVSDYQAATNWSSISSQIFPISE